MHSPMKLQSRLWDHLRLGIVIGAALLALGACNDTDMRGQYPERQVGGKVDPAPGRGQSTGLDASSLFNFGGDAKKKAPADGGAIAVNSFLWQASLDTVSSMPLASVDPFGGVIVTDWYSRQEAPDERFKVTVFVRGQELRADAVRVAMFSQSHSTGDWRDVMTDNQTATEMQNAILSRAHELRVKAGGER